MLRVLVRSGEVLTEAAGQPAFSFCPDRPRIIRAEVTPYDRLVEAGSASAAKEQGYMRLEGKDYVMQEADVVYFRFNV